jgi:ligand-binding sensor domain-containing protein
VLPALSLALLLAAPTPGDLLFERSAAAFTPFTTADGLPQNSALSLAVDAQGHLWVGTQEGLVVREGRDFRAIPLAGDSGDGAVMVTAILPASDGAIWVATSGDGVFRRRGALWEKLSQGLPSQDVRTLAEWQGAVWAGTGAGLARFEGGKWAAVAAGTGPAELAVWLVYPQPGTDSLWVGTETGLLRLRAGKWTLYDRDAGLPDNRVRSLLGTKDERGEPVLWVGTEGGLSRLRGETLAPGGEGLPAFPVYALAETLDAAGEASLWVGTYGGGLAVRRGGRVRVFDKKGGLQSVQVNSLTTISEGPGRFQIWVGTQAGLYRLIEGSPEGSFRSFPDGPEFLHEGASALAVVDQGPSAGVWVASQAGLFRFREKRWDEVPLPLATGDRPYSLYEEHSGAMLVGTEQGKIVRLGPDGAALVAIPTEAGNSIRSMLEVDDPSRGQELWVAPRSGLFVRRERRWVSYDTTSGLKSNWHFKIVTTPGKSGPVVWVGGSSGLARFDGERFAVQDAQDGLPGNLVTTLLAEVRAGRQQLWVGTASGAARYDADAFKVLDSFSPRSGPPLPNYAIYSIQPDLQGRHYLCTERGVVRLTDTPAGVVSFTFGREDGLPGRECVERGAAVDAAGRLWVATTGGLAVHEPQGQQKDAERPKTLVFERTAVHGQARDLEGARLGYRDNAVQFDYSLLSNFRDGETRYRTQLVGIEDAPTEWTPEQKREFPTLPSGQYEFRLWARDYAGTVAGPLVRRFSVAPPPWLSLWAFGLYALGLAAAVYGTITWRTRALRRTAALLELKVAERTKELSQANKDLAASQKEADRIFSALAEVLEGKVLDGRYRLEETIGRGGFGAVFKGTDIKQSIPVAVKVFRPQSGNESTEALARFLQEARSTQAVNHRNAVAVLDSGVSDGVAYTVMELLEGRSLKAELAAAGKLAPERVAAIGAQMLGALGEAHRKGIVHRDIKPENVFLQRTGEGSELVKVLDFGVAKTRDDANQGLTLTGTMVGTPVYMAPERLENKPYDGRSDVYSVGIVLYELLTGRPPFESRDGALWPLILAHVKQAPRPLREVEPSIPEGLSKAVLAALAKDPAQRPSAEELSALLTG